MLSPRILAYLILVGLSVNQLIGEYALWFDKPATSWNQDALPLGNGRIGVMIFGGTTTEQVQFTEETLWTGQPHDYSNLGASNYLRQLQAYIFATNQDAFWTLASSKFMSVPLRQCAFQPGGVLELTFSHSNASNYVRRLSLDDAIVTVEYTHGGVKYQRRAFASYPDNVVVLRIEADRPGMINFTARFTTPHASFTNSVRGNDLILDGRIGKAANGLESRIWFRAQARFINDGGMIVRGAGTITVTNANAVTILLVVGSNFVTFEDVSGDPVAKTQALLEAATSRGYEDLLVRHLADYRPLFQRVVIDFGKTWKTNLPTGARIKRVVENDDPALFALYLQFARYLMIAGSRPGTQPLTLQGKWNNVTNPSWEGKMTLNINQEMNYWIAEPANLSECHEPMFSLVRDLMVSGGRVARNHYGARGWVVHHNTDLWRGAAPINNRDGLWPTGSAWLCQHLWEHFIFTGDTNFLIQVAYPAMKAASLFYLDFLVQHPVYTNWWVTCPSYSPEHDNPVLGPNVAGPTMDNELIRQLFEATLASGRIAGEEPDFIEAVSNMMLRLPPLLIGRYGQLQEWLEDVDRPNDTHRHCSHLVGLYPGESISVFHTPALAMAARQSVEWRGYIFTDKGWAKSWRACLRARLCDGEIAYLHLTNLVAQNLSSNMMFTDIPNRQVDGTFGAAAAMIEMLLQSQRGEIHLLPALPTAWTNGSVRGLRARGGFEVDIAWSNHVLTEARVASLQGNTCRIRYRLPIEVWQGSNVVDARMVMPGVWEFPTEKGACYVVKPATVSEAENVMLARVRSGNVVVVTNMALSNWRGLRLVPDSVGAEFVLAVSNPPAGLRTIVLGINRTEKSGVYRVGLGLDPNDIKYLPRSLDGNSPTNVVYVLPDKLETGTNRFGFWTNMLTEVELVPVEIPAGATLYLRFVADRYSAGSGKCELEIDYIRFYSPSAKPCLVGMPSVDGIVLSWPARAAFWSISSTTNLEYGKWEKLDAPVTVVEDQCWFRYVPDSHQRFFRLESMP